MKRTEKLFYGDKKEKDDEIEKEFENLSLLKNMSKKRSDKLIKLGDDFGNKEKDSELQAIVSKLPRKKRNDAPLRFNHVSAKETTPVSLSKQLSNKNVTIKTKSSKKFEKKKSLKDSVEKHIETEDSSDDDDSFDFTQKKPVKEKGNINSKSPKNIDAILSKARKEKNKPLRLTVPSSENSESSESFSNGDNSVIRVVNIPSKILNTRELRELLKK